MDLGIIGLPFSGKTTVFNALTHGQRPVTASMGKVDIATGVVDVPDARIDWLSALYKPRKTIYARVTYADIAGLDRGAGKTGLSGPLRNQLSRMDAFVHVVRAFENDTVPHPLQSVDPQRDVRLLDEELVLADLVTVENRLQRIAESLRKGARAEERQALQVQEAVFLRLKAALDAGQPLRSLELTPEEREALRGYELLTLKPMLIIVNAGDDPLPESVIDYPVPQSRVLSLQGKIEMELAQLDPEEAELFKEEFGIRELGLHRVIRASYELLKRISFFTVGEDEVRAWTVREGANAVEAAGAIHTDLARGFIRAEVVAYQDIYQAGSMAEARKLGKVRLEGKDYIVQDGDILHVRFSV